MSQAALGESPTTSRAIVETLLVPFNPKHQRIWPTDEFYGFFAPGFYT